MWVWTNASDRTVQMPVDAAPVPNGNVRVYQDGHRLVCDVIGSMAERRKLLLGGWPLHIHHKLMCSKADKWSRRARPEPRPTLEAPEGLW